MPFCDNLGDWTGDLPIALVAAGTSVAERRGLLLRLAAAANGVNPDQVEILHEEGRAPRLQRPSGSGLQLSSAGRAGLTAVAVSAGPVGVDVELVEPGIEPPWRVLHPAEAEAIMRLPQRERAFARLWACKEAYLKALGLGLSRDPASFQIDLQPDGSASIRDPERPGNEFELATVWREVGGRCFALALASARVSRPLGVR